MDTTTSPDVTGTVDASAAVPVCPLNGLSALDGPSSSGSEIHNYIHMLEERLRTVENALRENHERTRAMGTMIFSHPASKMMLAAFPKDFQNKLKDMFGGSNSVTEKTNGNGNS